MATEHYATLRHSIPSTGTSSPSSSRQKLLHHPKEHSESTTPIATRTQNHRSKKHARWIHMAGLYGPAWKTSTNHPSSISSNGAKRARRIISRPQNSQTFPDQKSQYKSSQICRSIKDCPLARSQRSRHSEHPKPISMPTTRMRHAKHLRKLSKGIDGPGKSMES